MFLVLFQLGLEVKSFLFNISNNSHSRDRLFRVLVLLEKDLTIAYIKALL